MGLNMVDAFNPAGGHSNPPFVTHVPHTSFLNAANLGCDVWGVQTRGYSGIPDKVRYTASSIDYLAKCPVANSSRAACAAGKHTFSLTSPGGGEEEDSSRADNFEVIPGMPR